jgi:serine protease Do
MQKNYCRALGLAALVAGGTLLNVVPAAGQGLIYVSAMGESRAHVSQGYLGIDVRDVSEDQVAVLKLKEARGAEVTNLDHDGPACKAGLQIHDVILQINGQVVGSEEQLRRLLRDIPVGRSVSFLFSREGATQTLTLTTADRRVVEEQAWGQHYSVPAPGASGVVRGNTFLESGAGNVTTPKGHKDLLGTPTVILSSSFTGAKLEVMGPQLAEYFGATDGAGLLVRSVDWNSPAEEAGLRAGDVVVRINSISVSSGTDWTKTVHDNKGRPVPVVVLRDRHEETLTLTPDGKKRSSVSPDSGLEQFFQQTGQQARELLAKL